jgi:DNA (cytosine-5)-methyltransferase 1
MLQYLDLFSGIGGFHLAASQAGWSFDNTYHSEVNDYANAVYQRNFPTSIALGDIRVIDGHELRARHPGGRWLLTGGFPCQDISAAGQGAGLDGERSGLFFELCRLIDELRPEIVVCENVRALTSRGLDRVLQSLASLGYDAEWQVISAADFGAPHLRERLWIVAYPSVADSDLPVLVPDRGRVFELAAGEGYLGQHGELGGPIEGPGAWGDWQGEIAARKVDGRTVVCRMADGIPGGLYSGLDWGRDWDQVQDRGIALGNAIVPQVAEWIFRRIDGAGLRPE